jgi:hypothetical protein
MVENNNVQDKIVIRQVLKIDAKTVFYNNPFICQIPR